MVSCLSVDQCACGSAAAATCCGGGRVCVWSCVSDDGDDDYRFR